jgi:NAD(P)-dependent dehydrogenase (short-subunit alcohol dehydrogenase family)
MCELTDRVTIITGGASGIGAATARHFCANGARVVLADIQDGRPLATELGATFVETDVTDPAAVDALVTETVALHGRLDVYFNNAGIELHGPLAATDPEDHRRVIDVNLNGVYYGLQSAVRAMLENPGPVRGSIVNTASVAGLMGFAMMSSYNAAKGAVVLMTKNAAVEYAALGIRVNAVCPGIIRTPMAEATIAEIGDEDYLEKIGRRAHPMGRLGEAEEIARVVGFLASEEASFVTGVALPVDGGMTAGVVTTDLGEEN